MSAAPLRIPAPGVVPREPGRGFVVVVDADGVRRSLNRLAHEIVERNAGEAVLLAGIPTRGVPLARRLAALVRDLGCGAQVLELDVTGHRDDRGTSTLDLHGGDVAHPAPGDGSGVAAPAVGGSVVILVDDVIFHGRTARAALDALTELGRPAAVQLAVLVDRGHRELPIRADYVGKNIPTALTDRVEVHVAEVDGGDAVVVVHHG